LSLAKASSTTLLSYFLLQVTPSTIGADAVRITALRSVQGAWSGKISSVVVDRAYGVLSLAGLAVAGAAFFAGRVDAVTAALVAIATMCAAVIAGFVVSRIRLPRRYLRLQLVRLLVRTVTSTVNSFSDVELAARAVIYSLLTHGLCAGAFALCFWSIRPAASFDPLVIAAFPLVSLVALLPISVNGWGVRELALLALLGPTVGQSETLTASLLFGVAYLLAGLVCGALWVATGSMVSKPKRGGQS